MLNYESVSVYIAPGDHWPLHCMVLPLVLVPAQLSSSVQIAPLQTAVRCLWAVICHSHDRNIDCVEILVLSLPLLIHDIFIRGLTDICFLVSVLACFSEEKPGWWSFEWHLKCWDAMGGTTSLSISQCTCINYQMKRIFLNLMLRWK